MGLDKTIFESRNRLRFLLQKAGYAVLPFVFPACGVGAWHDAPSRSRRDLLELFIVAADVSHTPCLRQMHRQGRAKPGCIPVGRWDIPQEEQKRGDLEPSAVGGGVLSDPRCVGRVPLDSETFGLRSEEEGREPVGANDLPGAADLRQFSPEPRLGGDGKQVACDLLWAFPKGWTDVSSGQENPRASPV